MPRRDQLFETITTEGALLPSDFLQRLAQHDPDIKGLTPDDYHLGGGEKINEAISRSWNRLLAVWKNFAAAAAQALPASDLGTTLTRDKWLRPLFQELGYGWLATAKPFEFDDRKYAMSHGWQTTPIHLVSFRADLDERSEAIVGARRSTPHSMAQEFLNRSDGHLWAIVSNGYRLRLLRDNSSLTRQAYVEFDLQSMMGGEVYADFALLWLLLHQSRVEGDRPELCWLEKWTQEARQQGERILDHMRDGVQDAITALGQGFLAHPANTALRQLLRDGQLSPLDYYKQLLRIVYRFIFLFIAEDRDLLHVPIKDNAPKDEREAATKTREAYFRHYSLTRLRRMAQRVGGTKHSDLWHIVQLIVRSLDSKEGCPALGLPALGSFLWSDRATPALNDGQISNRYLLQAVRSLAITKQGRFRRPVDYKNIGAAEFGSVYESLLEQHPKLNLDAATFTLDTHAGNERKTTGSYYTPPSLVQCLLDSALEPVVQERLKMADKLASSEWRVVSGEIQSDPTKRAYVYSILSRLRGLAAGNDPGRTRLQADQVFPERGVVRADLANPQSRSLGSSQYRGGVGAGIDSGVSAVPSDSARQPSGVGNAPFAQSAGGAIQFNDATASLRQHYRPEQTTAEPSAQSGFAAGSEGQVASSADAQASGTSSPLTTPHSPLASDEVARLWDLAPLATRYSLLAEQAVLALKVCDKACGSGHFLIASAHRIARRLAAVRTGEDEPAPAALRHALRDVIGRCIYGVDINPMAVELCKFALWLEAVEPGKPLSFLDHHIQCGNSLIGATPALMQQGIPDKAFEPIEGDDKKYCAQFKKANKDEATQMQLFAHDNRPWEHLGNLAVNVAQLASLPDDTVADVQAKERRYAELVRSGTYESGRQLADTWCAAFVWKKRKQSSPEAKDGFDYPISNDIYRRLERNPRDCPPWMREEIRRLAEQYQFFHWHLAFPDVFKVPTTGRPESSLCGWNGGFDVILGNPPWDRLKHNEQEWFAEKDPSIATAQTTAARKTLLENLQTSNPVLFREFKESRRVFEGISLFIRESGRFPLGASGELNLATLFADAFLHLAATRGWVGAILPTTIVTDKSAQPLCQFWLRERRLVGVFDFENRQAIFPHIHRSYKFCLLTLRGTTHESESVRAAFFLQHSSDLLDQSNILHLRLDDIARVNPNTLSFPVSRTKRDGGLLLHIHEHSEPILLDADESTGGSWGYGVFFVFEMNKDSGLFTDSWQEGTAPLLEAKLIHQFNHRAATFEGQSAANLASGNARESTTSELADADFRALPRYWVSEHEVADAFKRGEVSTSWCVVIREITNSTNERTVIASLIPKVGMGHTCWAVRLERADARLALMFVANLNSIVLDYAARQKVGGTHMSNFILKQLPAFAPTIYAQRCVWAGQPGLLKDWLLPRVLELTYTAWDLEALARDCGYDGPPFRWDEERRFLLRCELDAAFFHLYGINGDDAAYILDTFPIVKRKDEAKWGTYRTKDAILEIYAALAKSQRTGQPYVTRLNPAPASIQVAHAPRFDQERIGLEVGDYILGFVFSILRYSGGTCDLMRLVRGYALLQQPKVLAALVEAQFEAAGRKWVEQTSQPHDGRWFLPILRRMETHDVVSFEVRGDDVIVHQKDPQGPRVDAAVATDAFLVMRVLDVVPDQAVAEPVKRIVPKAPRVALQEAAIPA